MIRFAVLILIIFISLTVSLPNCTLSYLINSDRVICSGTPNGTHTGLNYMGNCTASPDSPKTTGYKLNIDVNARIVHNFTVYSANTCHPGFEMLITKTPLLLNTCAPLFFLATSSNPVRIGSLMFRCRN